jgi:hypothetical protein
MSDEKNAEQTAEQTDKLGELFTAETDAGETGATAPLPEAEPAWLAGRQQQRPLRTAPRVRWAGIIWGLVFAAGGWCTVWTLLEPDRRAAFSNWILSLDDGGWAIVGALALGALLLLIGLSQGLKAATRPRR